MTTIECRSEFDFASGEYAELFAKSDATAFQHPIWLSSFYRNVAAGAVAAPLVLVLRDGRRLTGVVPLIRRRKNGLRLIETTDLGVSDYAAPVLSPGLFAACEAGPLRERVRDSLPAHDVLRLRPVRREHDEAWALLLGGERKPLSFSTHAVDLAGGYDRFRATMLDASLRRQMDRKTRKLKREHRAELVRPSDPDEVADAIRTLARLREGRFEGDVIGRDAALAHYVEVAVRGAASGFAETFVLRGRGETIGVVFGIAHRKRFHYLLIGCDYERWGKFSPGLLMYDGIIRDWTERGGDTFDFTIGDEPFKPRFGARATPMSVHVATSGVAGRLAGAFVPNRLMGEGAAA